MRGRVRFREVQRFDRLWMWLILLSVASVSWYLLFEALLGGVRGLQLAILVAVAVLLGTALPFFLGALRLESEVRSEGILVRFYPLHMRPRLFAWDEIDHIELVEYRPILDYGGWGIRLGSKGWAYNVSGKEGIRISFKDGRRDLLIGSRHPLEFAGSIESARRKG